MDAYKITDTQMDELYRIKTVMEAASYIGESANHKCSDITPVIELLAQLSANMRGVLLAAELIPDPSKAEASVRVI